MSAKKYSLLLLFLAGGSALWGAPPPPMSQRYLPPPDLREMVADLKRVSNNQEAEIHVLEEKLTNMEEIVESLQKDQKNSQKLLTEGFKEKSGNNEQRITLLEKNLQTALNELTAYKQHVEKQNNALIALHEKIAGYETSLAQQAGNIGHLQTALQTLSEILQGPSSTASTAAAGNPNSYQIQPGDSLGKIALKFGISQKALREENKLASDKIIVGQTLIIPAKP